MVVIKQGANIAICLKLFNLDALSVLLFSLVLVALSDLKKTLQFFGLI